MRKAQQNRSLVAAWFDFLAPTEAPIAQALHKTIRATVPDLIDTIRQGNLLMSLNGEPLLGIAPGRNQVQLLIFNGSDIEGELGPLEGVGRRQRVVKIESAVPVDLDKVQAIARASADACRRHQQMINGG